jgi:hypothetical protein
MTKEAKKINRRKPGVLILCRPECAWLKSNFKHGTTAQIFKRFVRVTTPKKIFEIDIAKGLVQEHPTSAEYQREMAFRAA